MAKTLRTVKSLRKAKAPGRTTATRKAKTPPRRQTRASVLDLLQIERELVLEFFALFSRFEYALKRTGRLVRNNPKATADWDSFANDLRGTFGGVADQTFQDALTFLAAAPPKTQIVDGNDLDWRDTPRTQNEHDEGYTLRLVRVIRNNLFHGGKFPMRPVADPARDKELLEAAIVVLNQCLRLNDRVRQAFEEVG